MKGKKLWRYRVWKRILQVMGIAIATSSIWELFRILAPRPLIAVVIGLPLGLMLYLFGSKIVQEIEEEIEKG